MKDIHITVWGDDKRLYYLNQELVNLGYQSSYYTDNLLPPENNKLHSDCMVFPLFPQGKLLNKISDYGKKGSLLCAGLPSKDFVLAANEYGFSVFDYMSDPHVSMKNTVATAEGALIEAMTLSSLTLQGNHSLIIGFGRCGEILATKCRLLGSYVTVCDCNSLALSHGTAHGFETLSSLVDCSPYHFIFNTAPYLNLTKKLLDTTRDDVVIIDLASAPGGTDFSYCDKIGRTAKLCSSLPAKYAPKTSGLILAHAIVSRMEKLELL